MADNDKLNYLSSWNIEQLITDTEVAVNTGTTLVHTPVEGAFPPLYSLEFKPTSSAYWYQAGRSSTNNTVAGAIVFYGYSLNNLIYAVADRSGTVRVRVWADKTEY